jgi:hypothetical protein
MTDSSGINPLFGPDLDWENNACLNCGTDQWGPYITGYDRAAEILASHVQSGGRDQDVLLYPIVFLSRHYLELLMKRTLLDAQDLLDRPRQLRGDHNLTAMWQHLRPLVLAIYPADQPAELAQLDSVVSSVGELDKSSFAFRYPMDKKGTASLPDDLNLVNIRRFSEAFRKGARLLEAIQSGIAVQLELRRAMRGEV